MRSALLLVAGAFAASLGSGFAQPLPEAETTSQQAPLVTSEVQTCDINVDNWNVTASDRTYHAPFYESTLTFRVRVNPVTCTWKIDNSQKPGWINLAVSGTDVGDGRYRGPAIINVKISKNTSYGRGGRVRFVSSSYSVPVDIDQASYTGACAFKPKGTVQGQWKTIAPGFLAVTQSMSMPSNNFSARAVDKSTCPLSPRPHAYTFGMTGATIQGISGLARTYQISRSGVQRNATGEGALFVMNQPGYAAFSGVLAQELPLLAALTPELQVKMSLDKTFISFADGGGVVKIGGSVKRMIPSSKPCLFAPTHFTVMAPTNSGPWLSVTSDSSCKASNPDSGTLVIAAVPNGPNARVGVIFTAWGNVIFVVQPAS
ncbi:MAG: hypothetical protein QOH06_4650 [Acidobacteriota bacterium]|jgi:hypothetical protein|nr:hypothetical protein [Acidobacteriota bacterium]